jgi:hypothetical protein
MDTTSSSGGRLPHGREGKCNARMKDAEKKEKTDRASVANTYSVSRYRWKENGRIANDAPPNVSNGRAKHALISRLRRRHRKKGRFRVTHENSTLERGLTQNEIAQ